LKSLVKDPLVSVIIPNYNYAKYLSDCLNSILNQSYLNLEIILVDDGSTDNSITIAESFGNRIKIIVQDHKGVNAARNLGIKNATGTFLAFCDSDDVWLPKKIELQVNFAKSSGEFGLIYSGIRIVDEDLGLIRNQDAKYAGDCSKEFLKHPSEAIVLLGASTSLISRELIDKVGLFDETMHGPGEDWDFFRRIAETSLISFIPDHLVLYRQHRISASRVPTHKYYEGNRNALRNMFRQNGHITLLNRRLSWMRLHWSFMKNESKHKQFFSALRELARAVGPIRS
jgi:glycosyltransferase involved in cell wall biosynthesis